MKKNLFLITLIVFSITFLSGWTTKQQIMVKNTSKQEIMNLLESFVVQEGYSFTYSNPDSGLFQIFVKQVALGIPIGNLTAIKSKTRSFSIQIEQYASDVLIKATSRGGIAPGKYFKGFVNFLKDSGFNVLSDKEIQLNRQNVINTTPYDNNNSNDANVTPETEKNTLNEFKLDDKTSFKEMIIKNNNH